MTPENENWIWKYLPNSIRCKLRDDYSQLNPFLDTKLRNVMCKYFGKENMEYGLPLHELQKPPMFKVGDKVRVLDSYDYEHDRGRIGIVTKIFSDDRYGWILDNDPHTIFRESDLKLYTESNDENVQNCTNPTENSISDLKIQSESAESVETSTKEDAYFAYRLDLAKEIAVAMIAANWEPADIPRDAVEQANEIVKRLKETEE